MQKQKHHLRFSKGGAKVEVFGGVMSHRCDLFVTSCDLMQIGCQKHKKSGLKRSLRVQVGYKYD